MAFLWPRTEFTRSKLDFRTGEDVYIFDRHISGNVILGAPADNLSAFMEPYKAVAVENALFLQVV